MRHRVAALVTGSVLAASLLGCGAAEKQEAVRKIAAATRRSEWRAGQLTLAVSLDPTSTVPALPGVAADTPVPTHGAPVRLDVVLDPAQRRAALLAPAPAAARIGLGPDGSRPVLVLFDGATTYVRRAELGLVGARAWYRLDTNRLEEPGEPAIQDLLAPRTVGDLAILSPITLWEQANGLLTGSVEDLGPAEMTPPGGGPPVTVRRYEANSSLEKTTRELGRDDDASRPVERLLHVFALDDEINPASVTVTPTPTAINELSVTYRSKPARRVRLDFAYSIALLAGAAELPRTLLDPPAPADTVRVTSLAQLRGALDQWAALE